MFYYIKFFPHLSVVKIYPCQKACPLSGHLSVRTFIADTIYHLISDPLGYKVIKFHEDLKVEASHICPLLFDVMFYSFHRGHFNSLLCDF